MINIEDILLGGEEITIQTTGRSMRPTFLDRKDYVTLTPCDGVQLEVGDVVFFNRGDQYCLHRIISISGDDLVIRGDGNQPRALERVRRSAVVARVTAGTMRGRAFRITDPSWQRNTRMVMKYFPLIALWHRTKDVLKTYPLSLIVLGALFYFSFTDPSKFSKPAFENADKVVHFLMYFGVSLVFWLEWMRHHRHMRRREVVKGILFCLVAPILLGGLIELGQEYLTGGMRSGDIMDFAADIAGSIVATIVSFAVTLPICNLRGRKA